MSLLNNIKTETVERLAVRDPIVVTPDTSIRKAAELMREKKLGCVMVVDGDQKVLGVFNESMIVELIAHHPDVLDQPVETQMASRFPWVRKSDPISFVLDAMSEKNVRLMCVLDEEDHPVGVTGQRGIMEYIAEHFPGDVTVQRIGMSPFPSDREGA